MVGGNQQDQHSDLKEQILIDLGSRPNVLIENTPNGLFRSIKGGRVIRIGRPGMPDIRGTIEVLIDWVPTALGVSIAVEVKTGSGTLRKDQRKWRHRYASLGGLYIIARRVEDVHAVIGPPGSVFTLTQLKEALNAQSASNSERGSDQRPQRKPSVVGHDGDGDRPRR